MFFGGKIDLSKVFPSQPSAQGPEPLPKNNDERLLAAIAHLLPMVGPLVPPHFWIFGIVPPLVFWQLKRGQSAFLCAVGLEVLNFQIWVVGLLTMASVLRHLPLIGGVLAVVIPLAIISALVLMMMAALECKQGRFVRYPWVQRIVK